MADSTTHYGLTKPLGTEYYNISVPNGNMDKIDTALHALGSGLAIIATGDTHVAAASGDFIYIHSHGTLAEGLYKATTSIALNAALSGSNVTAVTGGGLNTKVDKVSGKGLSANDYTTTEKTKLAGIESGAQVNPGAATTSAAGLMSAADKTKLNGIANNANNYSLPTAANGTKGGIQIGYSQNGKNYPVQLSSEKAYVNVPWSDTTYSDATTSTHGLMSAADKTKLNGISSTANRVDISTVTVTKSFTLAANNVAGYSATQMGYTWPAGYWPISVRKAETDCGALVCGFDITASGVMTMVSIANPFAASLSGTLTVVVACIKTT